MFQRRHSLIIKNYIVAVDIALRIQYYITIVEDKQAERKVFFNSKLEFGFPNRLLNGLLTRWSRSF